MKANDLYQISFQEYLKQNPDLKKLSKEIQNQKYNFYEEERKNNIKRCIQKRQEIINLTKKPKNNLKKNKSEEKSNEERESSLNNSDNFSNSKKNRNKSGYNIYNEKNKKIYVTEDSYVMSNNNGGKSLIKKEDLENVTCLKNEKSLLEKKAEEKDDYLTRLLKSEIMKEKKIRKVKEEINKKDKKIKKFLKQKTEGKKFLDNERYQDNQNKYERQKLYEKMLSNYDQKVYMSKKANDDKSMNKEKMEELREQIKDYEKKNEEYKQKITEMFDLKENEERKMKDTKKFDASNPDLGQNKIYEMEEKFEMDRLRRENALMSHMNQVQNKINDILEKNEKKEKKIKKAIQNAEKKREEKRIMQSMHYDEAREKIKDKQKKLEKERQKKLENLEKKDLKNFAIRQEKIKMYEERKKMNQQNYEEREMMKAKLKEILKDKKNLKDIENNENDIINNLLNN